MYRPAVSKYSGSLMQLCSELNRKLEHFSCGPAVPNQELMPVASVSQANLLNFNFGPQEFCFDT